MSISAQKTLDTILANDKMNVSLFFPNPIRQGITGGANFIFTYNREKEQYFGLIQANPGEQSNLLVMTEDGQVYSYILKYSGNISKLNYFIKEEESIGNENSHINDSIIVKDTLMDKINKPTYSKRFCEHLLKSKLFPVATKRKKGMVLRLMKVAYDKDEVYLVMEIKNKSGIDFEIDYLDISRVKGNKQRKASYQNLEQEVIYKYGVPRIIENKRSKRLVYVLPKFVLGDDEKLCVELKELRGSRKILLLQ